MSEQEQQQNYMEPQQDGEDKLSTGLQVLSFCIPIAGAIIYFTEKDKRPNKARSACYAALWGVGIGIALQVIVTLMGYNRG